ncbi:MAG: hypothetical protein QM628_16150 [Propionicimonas sp.]
MASHDQPPMDEQLETALRDLYHEEGEAVPFAPLDGRALAEASSRRSRLRWGLLAAAIVLLIAGVVVTPRLLGDRSITATPSPVPSPTMTPIPTATPTPSEAPSTDPSTTPGEENWYEWVRRADMPLSGYVRSVSIGDVSYHFSTGGKPCTALQGYRRDDDDHWSPLASVEIPQWWCEYTPQAAVHGDEIYLMVGDPLAEESAGEQPAMVVYRTTTDTWRTIPRPETSCELFRAVDAGVVCLSGAATNEPSEYSFLDYRTGEWRRKSASPQLNDGRGWNITTVRVAEQSLLLFPSYADSQLTLILLDPVSNQIVLNTTGRIPPENGVDLYERQFQIVAPGLLYVGPQSAGDDGTKGTVVDLRSGEWRDLDIPEAADVPGRLDSGAEWTKYVFGDEVAGYFRIRNHLYDPVADQWFALPQPPTVATPDAEPPDAENTLSWNPAIPGTMCADPGPGECWELVTVVLSVVAKEVER